MMGLAQASFPPAPESLPLRPPSCSAKVRKIFYFEHPHLQEVSGVGNSRESLGLGTPGSLWE